MTIYKQLSGKINHQVELIGTDSSKTMLLSAKNRCLSLNNHELAIDFCTIDESTRFYNCDIITSSLVLPYAPKPEQMLKEFFDRLRPGGLLVSSHWPHPSQVPFLGVLKCVSYFMANRERKELFELDSDITFSLWDENKVRRLYEEQGLCIQNWTVVDLPMIFPNIRCLLSFCRIANWFQDSECYVEAEKETLRILKDSFHLELQADTPFELPSKVIVVSASK